MIVALTMRLAKASDYEEDRDALSHDWCRYLSHFDVTPVFVPNTLDDPAGYLTKIGVGALLLTGGDDLGPLEGEKQGPAPTARDVTERHLLDASIMSGLPVLGICRGLQVINVFFGGRITRDIAAATGGDHVASTHSVQMLEGGSEFEVNSYHNQGVCADDMAPVLEAVAMSDDGVVEALRHPELDIEAVMWHPERGNPASDLDEEIFGKWLGQCA